MDFSNIFHQMEIEKLIRQSIQIIKDKYGLPEKGLLAGGSIANIVYGLHTNKDIVVNDIDIFILDRLVDYDTEFRTNKRNFIYTFGSKRKELIEDVDYNGIVYYRNKRSLYTILETNEIGSFNYIKYVTNDSDPLLVIKSFDINCTQVGYLIEEDKILYTEEFEEFIKTSILKVTNINTPSHTVIRLFKKKQELGAEIPRFELLLLHYMVRNNRIYFYKKRFLDKYKDLYLKYESDLSEFYKLDKWEDTNMYELITNSIPDEITLEDNIRINHNNFLFYIRKIYGNDDKERIWSFISNILHFDEYFDDIDSINFEEVEYMANIINYFPLVLNSLNGLKLNEQLELIKNINNVTQDEFLTIGVLENNLIRSRNTDKDDIFFKPIIKLRLRKFRMDSGKKWTYDQMVQKKYQLSYIW